MNTESKTALRNGFKQWLAQGTTNVFNYYDDKTYVTIIRLPKDNDFDYLYAQRRIDVNDCSVTCYDHMRYSGMYCRRDNLLYDDAHAIPEVLDDDHHEKRSMSALRKELMYSVRKTVEDIIGNNRGNLSIRDLSGTWASSALQSFRTYDSKTIAQDLYINNRNNEDKSHLFVYRCHYNPSLHDENSILSYIRDRKGYILEEATRYICDYQEEILLDFLKTDAVEAQYSAILRDWSLPIHYIKRIITAVTQTNAKTVNVTIEKNNLAYTFKAKAEYLRENRNSYTPWRVIDSKDRGGYYKLYGHSADFNPKEIISITYNRSVIYQAQTQTQMQAQAQMQAQMQPQAQAQSQAQTQTQPQAQTA